MEKQEGLLEELVELVLRQDKEIKKLNRRIALINQYIEVYEEYIKGEKD